MDLAYRREKSGNGGMKEDRATTHFVKELRTSDFIMENGLGYRLE